MSDHVVGLSMIVRNEEATIARALDSSIGFIDTWTIIDTGSTDGTIDIVAEKLDGLPGRLLERPWIDFGTNLTELMQESQDQAAWNLRMHADMTLDVHEGMRGFLEADEDASTFSWNVAIIDPGGLFYRYPYLTRGGVPWWYVGKTHEYLAPPRKNRPLLGLTLNHHSDGFRRPAKFEDDLVLLAEGVEAADSRAIFYTAQSLNLLGRKEEAIEMYRRREAMGGWEEESWYCEYQIAVLTEDVEALLIAHARRPWRHEPLTEAARLVASRGATSDILFLEPAASSAAGKMS